MLGNTSFVCLWLLSLGTALSVVFSTFESRQSIHALETLRREAVELKVSAGQFRLEKSALAAYPRIESVAKEKLHMSVPETQSTILIVRE